MKPKNNSVYLEQFLETGRIPVGIIDSHTHMNDVYGTCMCVYDYEETMFKLHAAAVLFVALRPTSD